MSKSPAQTIIEKVGGVARVAAICNRNPSWVYKWTYPRGVGRGGRNGYVPHEDAEKLMAAARRGEVDLTYADFFQNTEAAFPNPER